MSSRPKRSSARVQQADKTPSSSNGDAERERNKRLNKRKRRRDDSEEDFNPDSDDEFEKLMQRAEEEEDERLAKKKKKKEDKLQREQKFREDHQDFCEVCNQGGEVLLCDGCPKAYHKVCLEPELDEVPAGAWYCPACNDAGELTSTKKKKDEPPGNMDTCMVCQEGGFILCCDSCPKSYHAYCLTPPLEVLPAEDEPWNCPYCTVEEPTLKPNKVISWRWVSIPYPEPVAEADIPKEGENQDDMDEERRTRLMLHPLRKMEPRREREFFVKWKNMSYYHSTWISELPLAVHCRIFMQVYWNRNSDQEPPENEDGSTDADTGEVTDKDKEQDPHNLEKRFFRYGVKPEWMQINRIINHHQAGKHDFDYLVKWCELAYDQCTWEADEMDLPDFMEAINKYWVHRENMSGEKIPKSIEKKLNKWRAEKDLPSLEEERQTKKEERKKKYEIRKKYEDQPWFVEATGGKLHAYQLEGLNWMRHNFSQSIDAILADEMGLGKTVQAMTFLYSLFKEGHSQGPFLIAAPLSTIINWEREAEFWAPDFYVVTYCGQKDARAVIREHEITYDDVKAGPKATRLKSSDGLKFHVLLTSYECINVDRSILSSIKWEALVVDEAHRLKNNQSLFFRNLRDYSIKYKLLLTGTPLQNNLEELFHLLNFLSPDSFNNAEQFTHEFTDISKEDQISKLHSLLGPHMLRRLKADVLTGMPSKSELIVCVDMAPLQKKFYRNILTRNFEALNVKGGGKTVSLSNILMELKKCCNHPYLFSKAAIEAPHTKQGTYEGEAMIKACAKFELLAKMLKKLRESGHRVLIFSQMTKLLDILEEFCEYLGYKYERIDGSITGQMRQESIDRFNSPNSQHFIFLLSTRAGGLGINLATADTVVIYDSDWNPHNDIQAFSRAHRLGQRNHVMIYRFVTRNSVEERITTVAKKKMLLTHLVVRNNSKTTTMSKTELDDVLRWGTEELFKEEDEGSDQNKIVWDDESVDALLHRANEADKPEGEKKDWANDYLSSFKVAQYVTKEAEDKELEPEEAKEILKESVPEADPDYWERLLRHHYEQEQEVESQQLGKGKRVRRQVNYAAENMQVDYKNKDDDDYNQSSDDDGTGESGLASGDEENFDGERRRKNRERDEKLPALLARVQGQLEVLGFNPRQRKAFYNAVMRFGMPPPDAYSSQWLVRDLRVKSEKAFKAYASLFMRHLCEPGSDSLDHFNDGVPREGLNRQMVLARIGVMALIRRKVQEFQEVNGVWSLPEESDKVLAKTLHDMGIHEGEEEENSNSTSKEASSEPDKSSKPKEEAEPHEHEPPQPQEQAEMEVDDAAEKENAPDQPAHPNLPGTASSESDEDKPPRPVMPFRFNICDGGFTELHTIWQNEEDALTEQNKDYEVWNRRHDYWLLAGFATHGYARYNDILQDARFSILNEGFVCDKGKSSQDVRIRFMQRRYKLLEQALIIEEQLRRAANLNYGQKPPEPEKTAAPTTSDEKPDQPDRDSKDELPDLAEKADATPPKNNNLDEPSPPKQESAATEPDAKPEVVAERVEKRYAQITSLVDANQALAKEAFAGNKSASSMLLKVLSQLEDILNDMKSDVSRLPASVAQLPVVSERLDLTERTILNRLTTKDPEATAGVSPLPPPGPFCTPVLGARFQGIQPKFASLVSKKPARTPLHGMPSIVAVDEKSDKKSESAPAEPSPSNPSNGAPPAENGTGAQTSTAEPPTEPKAHEEPTKSSDAQSQCAETAADASGQQDQPNEPKPPEAEPMETCAEV